MTTLRKRHAGFSLLEVMIGVMIGMIGIVVIFQSLQIWESRKRTTASGSDAQVAGTLGMFNLERDLRLAGFGFGKSTYMGCTVSAYDTTGRGAFTFPLVPVQIVDGGAAGPDQIISLHGNSAIYTDTQNFTLSSVSSKKAQTSRNGYQVNDVIVAAGNTFPPGDCAMAQVSGLTNADGLTVDHLGLRYNAPAGTVPLAAPTGSGAGSFTAGVLFNLGPTPQRMMWRVSGNVLSWSEDIGASGTWNDVAEGIVDLQAEYGIDTNNDGQIASAEWTSTAPMAANWLNLRAIRVALLARSQQYEKPGVDAANVATHVTPNLPTWTGSATSPFVVKNLDGSAGTGTPANPADHWKNYRYRVYEEVIPLRNVIWGMQAS